MCTTGKQETSLNHDKNPHSQPATFPKEIISRLCLPPIAIPRRGAEAPLPHKGEKGAEAHVQFFSQHLDNNQNLHQTAHHWPPAQWDFIQGLLSGPGHIPIPGLPQASVKPFRVQCTCNVLQSAGRHATEMACGISHNWSDEARVSTLARAGRMTSHRDLATVAMSVDTSKSNV